MSDNCAVPCSQKSEQSTKKVFKEFEHEFKTEYDVDIIKTCKFVVGDIICLNSGSVEMTVENIKVCYDINNNKIFSIDCIYFTNGVLTRDSVNESCLRKF